MTGGGWRKLHEEAAVVDMHAHPGLKVSLFRRSLHSRLGPPGAAFAPFSLRTGFDRLEAGGVDLLLSAIHIPEALLLEDIPLLKLLRFFSPRLWSQIVAPPYFTATQRALDQMEAQVATPRAAGERRVVLARTPAELDALLKTRDGDPPIVFVHTIEGAHSLQGPLAGKLIAPGSPLPAAARAEVLDNLETLAGRGVAMITLAHFYPNVVANPVFHLPEGLFPLSRWRQAMARHDLTLGLGPLGEDVVRRMLELGVIVDVAHCTPAARAHVYRLVERAGRKSAVVASHVGAQAINPSPYNLADWEIRWLADHGGVAGVIFMNYWLMPHEKKLGLDAVSRTLDHFVNVGGSEVAAIGTDFDGFTDPPDDLLDASQLPRLTRQLAAARAAPDVPAHDEATVAKILGGNALRVLREGWRSGTPGST